MTVHGDRPASLLWGPLTRFGLLVAVAAAAVDQATKLWLLFVFDLGARGIVTLTPFLDLVLTWNTGISYGLFRQEGPLGQWALLALKAIAVALLWIWLARATWRPTAVALGLIIGGAIGNAIDRFAYGAVADFVLFHVTTAEVQLQMVRLQPGRRGHRGRGGGPAVRDVDGGARRKSALIVAKIAVGDAAHSAVV